MSIKNVSVNLTKDDVFHAAEKLFGKDDLSGFFGKNLEKAVQKGKSSLCVNDFYIAILMRNDPFVFGKMMLLFIPRITCPNPHPNQIVYKHMGTEGTLSLLWSLPDPTMIQRYVTSIPNLKDPGFLNIYYNCLKFIRGELQKLSNVENKI